VHVIERLWRLGGKESLAASALGRIRRPAVVAAAAVMAISLGGSLAATQAMAQSAGPHQSHPGGLTLTKQFFGTAIEPYTGKKKSVFRYTLSNSRGMSVRILSYGGIVQSINVPGRHGREADVVLGFRTLADYVTKVSPPVIANGGPYFGELIGRYGNRIAKGTFKLRQPDGKVHTYTLPLNNGVNALHGGLVGFGNHIWASQPVVTKDEVGVRLTLISPNRDEHHAAGTPGCPTGCTGYPAELKVVVTYTLNSHNQLRVHYAATDESAHLNTVLNLTNHSYFNLAGESSGSAASQSIFINANRFTPTDSTLIPTGVEAPVAATPFDFRNAKTIASAIEDCTGGPSSLGCQQLLFAQGLDHNWVLNRTGPTMDGLHLAAIAADGASGRRLTVWTDQPGVQFYTSNFLNGTLVGNSGHIYRQTQAYTFETQHFPNSPNQPNFPSTELRAGKTFTSTTVFAFSS
jgi:aldose 1-epimerase